MKKLLIACSLALAAGCDPDIIVHDKDGSFAYMTSFRESQVEKVSGGSVSETPSNWVVTVVIEKKAKPVSK